MLDYEKYIKSIAKSLETIASVLSDENKREKEEMKKELEKEKREKEDAIETGNEIIAILESENINVSKDIKDDIITSLSE